MLVGFDTGSTSCAITACYLNGSNLVIAARNVTNAKVTAYLAAWFRA